jgi:GNAT superfamily N-acetyltransferase
MAQEEYRRDHFSISTDQSRLDLEMIHQFLSRSYWAKNIPLATVRKSIQNSLCFGVYDGKRQIGFARVITDRATFAYLADVFILDQYRGKGLSKWLMECIMGHPELQGLRSWMLFTRDAHGLYRRFGFETLTTPERVMVIRNPDVYGQSAEEQSQRT